MPRICAYQPNPTRAEPIEAPASHFDKKLNANSEKLFLLLRPYEVLSRIANTPILEVAHNALGILLQHRHVIIRSLA